MEALRDFFGPFDIWQVLSSFVFLIAIIDPFGNIPITISMQQKGITPMALPGEITDALDKIYSYNEIQNLF